MQRPTIVFDHIRREVAMLGAGDEMRLAELIEMQRKQVTTSGRPSTGKR